MITPIKNMQIKDTNTWYPADTGMDIAVPVGTEVRAVADGTIIYSEFGHTPWQTYPDTPGCILVKLDVPQSINGTDWTLVWYCHLSSLANNVPDDGAHCKKVSMGTVLGKTGIGNQVPHLHFGILTNREQADGDFMEPAKVAEYIRKLIRMGKNL